MHVCEDCGLVVRVDTVKVPKFGQCAKYKPMYEGLVEGEIMSSFDADCVYFVLAYLAKSEMKSG
jgi:hypothetical protein